MTTFDNVSWLWAAVVVVGFPALLLLFNELVHGAAQSGSAITPTLRSVRNLLLPASAVTALILLVIGAPADGFANRVVLTLFWIAALYVALQIINDVFFGAAPAGSWRATVPALFRAVVRSLLVGAGVAIVYSQIWGYELAGALTALGVGSLVLGLALQEPLGNVFAGLMLLFEAPVKTGEWIEVDGKAGRVVDLNWRSINMESLTHETIVVPNSVIYKSSFSNLSRPTSLRTFAVELSFSFDDPPNRVKEVLLGVARTVPGVLTDPPPVVRTNKFADFAVEYHVLLSVCDHAAVYPVRDEFMTRTWYAAQRGGLTIPYPISTEVQAEAKDFLFRPRPAPESVLAAHPRFQESLRNSDASQLHMQILRYSAGEHLLRQGDEQDGLALLLDGKAVLRVTSKDGKSSDLGVLGAGEFYGEHSVLAGSPSNAALIALTDVRAALFDLESSRRMIDASPKLAREIGETIDRRNHAVRTALRKEGPAA